MDNSIPSFWEVIAAPWVGVVRPSYAARIMSRAIRWHFLISFAVGIAALVIVIFAAAVYFTLQDGHEIHSSHLLRDVSEAWSQWHSDEKFGPAEGAFLALVTGIPALAMLMAWLLASNVLSQENHWASCCRVFRVVAGGIGLLVLLTLTVATVIALIWIANRSEERVTNQHKTMLSILFSLAILIAWLEIATRSIFDTILPAQDSSRCEGCGYELLHVPNQQKCPECGLAVKNSLDAGHCRPGSAWQIRPTLSSWAATILTVVVHPRNFYARLRLRTALKSGIFFRVLHYPVMAFLGAMWIWGYLSLESQINPVLVALIVSLLITLLGWGIHRLAAALVATWCMKAGPAFSFDFLRTIICYESSYLWVFCAYNGFLIASFIAWDHWASAGGNLFLPRIGIPAELFFVMAGNAVLFLNWLRRYRIAILRTQWSNF